jgi:hypothetical protein
MTYAIGQYLLIVAMFCLPKTGSDCRLPMALVILATALLSPGSPV